MTLRRKLILTPLLLLVVLFLLVNIIAFMQARAMTHFAIGNHRQLVPEQMSLSRQVYAALIGISLPRPTNTLTPADLGMTYEAIHIPSLDQLDLELWHIAPTRSEGNPALRADDPGSTRPASRGIVLLLPGYSASKSSVLGEAKAFAQMGFEPILLDFRGAGGSAGNESSMGYRETDDVTAAVRYVKSRCAPKRLILFATSMGAASAMRAISTHAIDQPDALILESPYSSLLDTISHHVEETHLPVFPLARLLVAWGSVQQRCVGLDGFDMRPVDFASAITCPVLFLRGSADRFVTREESDSVYDNLAGEKTLVEFSGIDHHPPFRKQPDAWTHAVAGFLEKTLPNPTKTATISDH